MYELKIKNLVTGTYFIKNIDSPYLFEKFINKLKYSNKLKLIGYTKYY